MDIMKAMNFRIRAAGEICEKLDIGSVLDVGCRGCEAKSILPSGAEYYGNDLFQNDERSVTFVGDVLEAEFGRTFDCVMALDIIEHVDDPYALMDKLFNLSDNYLLVSLPNIYDLPHKYDFVFKDTLGKKYQFDVKNSLDRHRWVMSYDEIYQFLSFYSQKYDMRMETKDLIIGEHSSRLPSKIASKLIPLIFGKKIMTRTVMALFSK